MNPKLNPRHEEKRPLPDEAFDRIPRLALVFTDEAIYLTHFNQRGEAVLTRPVDDRDVASAFDSHQITTRLLPERSLFYQMHEGYPRLGIWLPPTRYTIHFQTSRIERTARIPLPGFVFVGKDKNYAIFAARRRPVRESDALYCAPLPNVHEDGAICAGNVKFPRASEETMIAAAKLFFESMFNSDLDNGKVRDLTIHEDVDPFEVAHCGARVLDRRDQTQNLIQFLCALEGKKEFPSDHLMPSITMRELINGGK